MWKSLKMILGDSKTSTVLLYISCDELNYYFMNIGSNSNEPDEKRISLARTREHT